MNDIKFDVHVWEKLPPHPPLCCTIFLDPKDDRHDDTCKPVIKAGPTSLDISSSSNAKQNELVVKANRRHFYIFYMVESWGKESSWSHYSIKDCPP